MTRPVFYDPRQARWKRLKRLFDALAICFMLLVIFFLYNALHGEQLPTLFWKAETKPYHALRENEKQKARERRRLAAEHRSHRHSKGPEMHYVLEGDLIDGGRSFGPGGFLTHAAGQVHGPHESRGGAKVLTVQHWQSEGGEFDFEPV